MDKNNNNSKPTRRDFIYTLTATLGVLGAGASVWPIVSQMNPDSSVKALSTVEVDISKVEEGKEITTSSITYGLFKDTRDNYFNPTSGYRWKFENTLAGIGGDTKFYKSVINVKSFYQLIMVIMC